MRLSRELLEATSADALVDALAKELKLLFDFPQTVIYFLEAEQEPAMSVLWKARGELPQVPRVPVKGDLILTEVFQATEPIIVADARSDPRTNKEVIAKKGARTLVFLPILLSEERRGFVSTGTFGEREWEADEPILQYLSWLSRHLSLALDRLLILRGKEQLAVEFSHAQKMEMVGRMAAASAHELRNLLTAVLGYTSLLQEHVSPEDADFTPDKIEKAAVAAVGVVQQLLSFSRRPLNSGEPLMLGMVIEELRPVLAGLLPENTSLSIDIAPELGPVKGHRSQIEQLLVHLVVNSVEALSQGGEIVVSATPSGPRFAHEKPERWVRISVEDSGPGFCEEARTRAFEPFFSTKGDPRNSGLGLFTCYGIVREMGGQIWLESGKKSVVSLQLPVLGPKASPSPSGKILLLEREPSVVSLIESALSPLCPEGIRLAESLPEALEVLSENEIHLIIAGNALHQVARQARAGDPSLSLLCLRSESSLENGDEEESLEYPFTAEELWNKVQALLMQPWSTERESTGTRIKDLVTLSERLLCATELGEVLAAATWAVQKLVGYKVIVLYLLDDARAETAKLWEYHGQKELFPLTIPVTGDLMFEEILRMEGPVVAVDCRTDPRTNKELTKAADLRTSISIPFRLTDGRIGSFGTGTHGDEVRPPSEIDLELLEAVTGLSVVALERLNLMEERQSVQSRFLRGQHLDAVALLGRGLADDLRNALTGIDGFTHLAQATLAAEHPAQELLAKIEQTSAKAARVIEKLVAFTRPQADSQASLELNSLVHSLAPLLRKLVDPGQVTIHTSPEPCWVDCDWEDMEQLVLNLVMNAKDAIEHTGHILVSTRREVGGCRLTVKDDGAGMEPEVAGRAFDPFFTTKSSGRGTGLGLPTCRRIAQQVGGNISLASQAGQGTAVKVFLPESSRKPA